MKHRQVARAAAAGEHDLYYASLALGWLRQNAEHVATRANDDMDDAPRGVCYEPRSRSGQGPGTPTEARALSDMPDHIALAVAAVTEHLAKARRNAHIALQHAQRAERAARSLLAMDPEEARKLSITEEVKHDEGDETRSTVCANPNCQRVVARTRNDRLRGGRCDACRKYLDRTSSERPRHLCALDDDLLGTDGLGLDETRLIVEEL